jgi:hypothetical protein
MIFLMHGIARLAQLRYNAGRDALLRTFQGNSMTNRFIGATLFARTMASQPATWSTTTRVSAKGVLTTAQHT